MLYMFELLFKDSEKSLSVKAELFDDDFLDQQPDKRRVFAEVCYRLCNAFPIFIGQAA